MEFRPHPRISVHQQQRRPPNMRLGTALSIAVADIGTATGGSLS
jgi:hypothetical protein